MDNLELIAIAEKARENSYSPYSKFRVGAALLTCDDKTYTGCNIENASYSATICAERTAIFKAVSDGIINFKKIAIMSSSNDFTYPCGICLQVMTEFMPDGKIILGNKSKEIKIYELKELLPFGFKDWN